MNGKRTYSGFILFADIAFEGRPVGGARDELFDTASNEFSDCSNAKEKRHVLDTLEIGSRCKHPICISISHNSSTKPKESLT